MSNGRSVKTEAKAARTGYCTTRPRPLSDDRWLPRPTVCPTPRSVPFWRTHFTPLKISLSSKIRPPNSPSTTCKMMTFHQYSGLPIGTAQSCDCLYADHGQQRRTPGNPRIRRIMEHDVSYSDDLDNFTPDAMFYDVHPACQTTHGNASLSGRNMG